MTTKNPRIHLVLEKPLYKTIENLARNNELSLSSQVRDLLVEAIETHEDMNLGLLAEQRAKTFNKSKALSHDEFWKKVLK